MQAMILAAGMGKRLKELTSEATKCMVRVNGVTMIERMLAQLDALRLSRIVLVVGYEAEKLKEYIATLSVSTPIVYVENDVYHKTNNIYSLYLAREYLLQDDTLLLESDLIFEDEVLTRLVQHPHPSLALVAKYESWMDGTVVTLGEDNSIKEFLDKKHFRFADIASYYKTVNIYKFSKAFSSTHYVPFLEAYVRALGENEYYEQVLKVIILLDKPEIKALPLHNEVWYEIDDIQDLDIAQSKFAATEAEKFSRIMARYGGYWRYPNLIDFCYLVNPFYPPQQLMDEIKANFERLLMDYPSGAEVNALLAAKNFALKQQQVVVGNGAAELIKSLTQCLKGKIGVISPTFEEYPNRLKDRELLMYQPENPDFSYTDADLIQFFTSSGISTLVLVNPDNPSGNFISHEGLLRLVHWAKAQDITLVVDESFVDFAESILPATLLTQDILALYEKLIVIKSISKSYGVPGLRLGILACADAALIRFMKKDVAIWNINSFAEFYLQIAEKYEKDYRQALVSFCQERTRYLKNLAKIPNLRLIPTQANYVMIELLNGHTAARLSEALFVNNHLLIKDLSSKKKGISGQYIRLAVKNSTENDLMCEALRAYMA